MLLQINLKPSIHHKWNPAILWSRIGSIRRSPEKNLYNRAPQAVHFMVFDRFPACALLFSAFFAGKPQQHIHYKHSKNYWFIGWWRACKSNKFLMLFLIRFASGLQKKSFDVGCHCHVRRFASFELLTFSCILQSIVIWVENALTIFFLYFSAPRTSKKIAYQMM